jgi:outer membrane lipoprotein SlyB
VIEEKPVSDTTFPIARLLLGYCSSIPINPFINPKNTMNQPHSFQSSAQPAHMDLTRDPFNNQLRSCIHLDESGLERLESNDRAEGKQWTEIVAHNDQAIERANALSAIAQKQWNPYWQQFITFGVGMFGAMVIGGSMSSVVDATGRGPLAAITGGIAGGVLAALTDKFSSGYMTKRHMRHAGQQALVSIQKKREANPTQPEQYYNSCQQQLVYQVENAYLAQEPKSEKYMAIGAIAAEGLISLVLTLPAGLPLALASAAFPIVINLIAARVQSDHFEVPEACEKLIPAYEVFILPDTISPQEALEVERLHAAFQYVALARPPKGLNNSAQAKGLAQIKFAENQVRILEEQGMLQVADLKLQNQEAHAALSDRCPLPKVNGAGLTAEQAHQAEQQWRDRWLEEERRKLDDDLKRHLEWLQVQYGQAIAYWRHIESQGTQEYRDYEP